MEKKDGVRNRGRGSDSLQETLGGKNPYSENLLLPKNEVPGRTSHHMQRDRADELNLLSFVFLQRRRKETEIQHHHKAMGPMESSFPFLLWVEGRSPVQQQCCTSGSSTHPLWQKINANSFCRWEQPLNPSKNEIIFIFPTNIYSPPIFCLSAPSSLFPLDRQMCSELVWVDFDSYEASEPPHLSSCTEDEEMMGT